MQPPVNVDLHVAGIELRRGDVDPGEVVSLRVDTEKFLEAFGNLIVDFTGIGDDGTPTLVQIDLTPLGDLASIAPSRWIDRSVVRGVPPGRWRYEICGPLLASTSGEVEIVPGGHTMIRAEPRTP
jgi:hypothetical protein